ncbi:Hypothetical protein CINCED_3A022154 [Cinara cedri]|uniref:Uncharacterized protein n=1 Tax=Cinara cedri TaxID=506608 RepID=A0A5E4NJK4_9HEMI|nr:Hypothetical protein CINCED_3A022154 [Cinara cedri]
MIKRPDRDRKSLIIAGAGALCKYARARIATGFESSKLTIPYRHDCSGDCHLSYHYDVFSVYRLCALRQLARGIENGWWHVRAFVRQQQPKRVTDGGDNNNSVVHLKLHVRVVRKLSPSQSTAGFQSRCDIHNNTL